MPDASAGAARAGEAMADFGGRPATRGDLACRAHRQRCRQRASVGHSAGGAGATGGEIRRRVRPSAMGRRRPDSLGDLSASAGRRGRSGRDGGSRGGAGGELGPQGAVVGNRVAETCAAASRRRGAITRSDRSMRRVPVPEGWGAIPGTAGAMTTAWKSTSPSPRANPVTSSTNSSRGSWRSIASNARPAGWATNGNRPRVVRRRGHHRKPLPAARPLRPAPPRRPDRKSRGRRPVQSAGSDRCRRIFFLRSVRNAPSDRQFLPARYSRIAATTSGANSRPCSSVGGWPAPRIVSARIFL